MIRRIALLIAAALAALGLLVLVWIGSHTRMVADDFCTSALVARVGVAGLVVHQYAAWSGRFAFQAVTSLVAAAGPASVRVLPAIMIVCLFGAFGFAFRRLTRVPPAAAVAVALVMTWSATGASPDLFQSVFWASGSATYTLPLALVALWMGVALPSESRPLWSHLLLTLAAGFAETLTAIIIGGLSIAVLFWRERRRALFGGLGCAIAGAVIMVAAPGNSERASRFSTDAGRGIAEIGADFARFVQVEISIAGASLLLVAAVAACVTPRSSRAVAWASVAAAVLIVGWALAIPFVLGRLAMGIAVPLRALTPTHAVLVASAVASGWWLGGLLPERRMVLAALAVILLVIPLAADILNLTRMAGGVAAFAAVWDDMDSRLRASRGAPLVLVEAPQTVSRLHFISASPEFWSNKCVAEYYGVGAVAARAPAEGPP